MASFELLAIILTGLGLTASITYYAMVLRNQNKTRQAQLFMQVHSQWKDRAFIKGFYDMLNNWEWENIEDFWAKYGQNVNEEAFITAAEVCFHFEGVGQLLRDGLIDIDLVDSMYSTRAIDLWEKLYPIAKYLRAQAFGRPNPDYYKNFEYLYTTLKKRRETLSNVT